MSMIRLREQKRLLHGGIAHGGMFLAGAKVWAKPAAVVPPVFTVQPSLTGSTALGSTITVSLGAASGTPAPALTGTLNRPGKAAAAVADGATFQIEASDQGGTIALDVTATNAAGSATASTALAVPAAAPPTVQNVTDGGNKLGTTATVTNAGTVTITNVRSFLNKNTDFNVMHYMVQVDNMMGKTLTVRRAAASPNNDPTDLNVWQMAWAYDPHGDWFAFDSVVNSSGTIVATKTAPLTQPTVYIARRPAFTNTRWDAAIARWKASPLTAPTTSADANFVIGNLPSNTHAPAMALHGFKVGTGAKAVVVTGGIHPDEHIAGYSYEAFMDWLLGASAEAVWLRDNCTFYCYPKLNPQGRYAGASRVETTSGEDANRIFYGGSFDHIPLSKVLRDAWTADLPATISGYLDFHDYGMNDGRGMVYHTDAGAFAQRLNTVYQARTGVALIIEPSVATQSIGRYLIGAHSSPDLGVAIEHKLSKNVGVPEWQEWGRDIGRALKVHYEVVIAGPPAPVWITPTWKAVGTQALPVISQTTNPDGSVTVVRNGDPKAAFLIPEGKTIEVQIDLTLDSNVNTVVLRQTATNELLFTDAIEHHKRQSSTAPYSRLQQVTWTADKPWFGVVCARINTGQNGQFTIGPNVKYRVLP